MPVSISCKYSLCKTTKPSEVEHENAEMINGLQINGDFFTALLNSILTWKVGSDGFGEKTQADIMCDIPIKEIHAKDAKNALGLKRFFLNFRIYTLKNLPNKN